MHFCIIFAIFAFWGVHSSHFSCHFLFRAIKTPWVYIGTPQKMNKTSGERRTSQWMLKQTGLASDDQFKGVLQDSFSL